MMTEAELISGAMDAWSNNLTALSIYITVISAYLITAYTAGKKMTRSQVIIVTVIFTIFAFGGGLSMYGYTQSAMEMGKLALDMSTQRSIGPAATKEIATAIIFVTTVPAFLASLKFMWDVRSQR